MTDQANPAAAWPRAVNRLLLVEDNAPLLQFIRTVAQRLGYEVIATSTLERRPELHSDPPTLALLDVHTDPEPYTAFEMTRAVPDTVPIVLMSGDAQEVLEAAVTEGRSHGAWVVGMLVKPFGLPALRQLLIDHRREAPLVADVRA